MKCLHVFFIPLIAFCLSSCHIFLIETCRILDQVGTVYAEYNAPLEVALFNMDPMQYAANIHYVKTCLA